MDTIREVLDRENGNYTSYECYVAKSPNDYNAHYFYTDSVDYVDSVDMGSGVITYHIYDIEDLERTVYSNCGVYARDVYDEGEKVLMLLISPEMNESRRNTLQEISDQIEELKAKIEAVQEEEEECHENMIEGTEMYDLSKEAIANMSYAVSSLKDAIDYLTSAVE